MPIFYHADRELLLQEGMRLELSPQGLSKFGEVYWDVIHQVPPEQMHRNSAELREFCAEVARQESVFTGRFSRHCSFFGVQSIEESKAYARTILPPPDHPIPIFEVQSEQYQIFDSTWLDFDCPLDRRLGYSHSYWSGLPSNSPFRPPRWEVVMCLPVTIGPQVGFA